MRGLRLRLTVSGLMLAVALAAVLLGGTRELTRAPEAVVVGGPVHNFGSMPPRATGRHSWIIRNAGRAPLRLIPTASS